MSNDNIYNALGVMLESLRPFLVEVISKNFPGEPWEGEFFKRLPAPKQETWNQAGRQGIEPILRIDYSNMAMFASKFRDELAKAFGNDKGKTYIFSSCMSELQEARNKCQHYVPLSADEQERAFSNMIAVANMLGKKDLRNEIDRLKNKHTYSPAAVAPIAVTTVTSDPANISMADDGSPLKPWYKNCLPHYDIRSGVLDESVFAANLNEVALGTGPEVYNNPTTFFAKTYVTAGLRDIATRVVKALNGEETENRVISLQTGFGGGKTHTLISIYHIIKSGARLLESESCANILPEGVKPNFGDAKVVVFTNNTTDVSQGRQTSDGLTIHTLWGEIAYQLGGKAGYEQMRANDEEMIAPTSTILKPILSAAGTSLILIDELADYCVKASAKKVGGGNLYNQTNSFMQTLTETVASVPRCVLIATLPASKTEVSDSQIGQEVLDSLQERIVRIGANVKPVDDEEVFEVVRRRLFEQINDEYLVDLVAKRYKDMIHNRRNDLPDYSDRIEYANKIKKSYPFHPELIEMFRQRWGSDSRFQRTRGVLRLLASIVQDIWKRRDTLTIPQALIHTSDVNLENLGSMTGTITNLMGSQWESVMIADVYGSSCNARKIDGQDPETNIGRYKLTQGLATTLLLASVGVKQKGLDLKQLKLCMLRPNSFNHNDIDGALNKYEHVAHYLHTANVGNTTYWFESKANINILLSQAKAEIKKEETDAETVRRLKESASFVSGMNIIVAPTGDIAEQKTLTLVILHPQYAMPVGGGKATEMEKAIKAIALSRGNADRIYRNTIFYLACTEVGRGALKDKLRNYLACNKILAEYASKLERDQIAEINNRKRDYGKQANEALIRAYNVAIRYSAKNGMESYEIKNFANDFSTQVRTNLKDEILEEEWIIQSIGRNLLDRINMLPTSEKSISVKDLYETFLRFDDKPMIIGEKAIEDTVNRYCSAGLFNVAMGSPDHFLKIYHEEQVPLINVNSDEYWLVDSSYKQAPKDDGKGEETQTTKEEKKEEHEEKAEKKTKEYSSVRVSGSVNADNFMQLYNSFVNTLKGNGLKITVEFTAHTTKASPLLENSALVKSVKESASQLGLKFETDE